MNKIIPHCLFLYLIFIHTPFGTTNIHAAAYTYDNINRLVEVKYEEGKTISYSYDPAGNILTITSSVPDGDYDNDGIPDSLDPDDDNDGIPDDWEFDNGFDSKNAADAAQDWDGDGFSNLTEYKAGTDPRNKDDLPNTGTKSGFLPSIYMLLRRK